MFNEIEYKVMQVRRYIQEFKGVDIQNINLSNGEDLDKLNYAYKYAKQYFNE